MLISSERGLELVLFTGGSPSPLPKSSIGTVVLVVVEDVVLEEVSGAKVVVGTELGSSNRPVKK